MSDQELPPTRLIVIRHGESNVTVERRIGGIKTCTGLSDLGSEQAARLRDRIASGDFPDVDELWASNLPRAIETAEIMNEALGLDLQINPDFEEFRPGEVDGLLFDEYVERYGMVDQLAEPHRVLSPGGESRASFFLRVGDAFDELVRERAGKSIVVACHGGVVDAVFRILLGLPAHAAFQMWTTNTSITEFITVSHGPPRQWRVARYNDAAHLFGLPESTPPTTT